MKRIRHKESIFVRIFLPLLLVVALQAALLYGILLVGGVFSSLEKKALNLMQEQSDNSSQRLQSNMSVKWTNLSTTEENLNVIIQESLNKHSKTWSDIATDSELSAEISNAAVNELIYRLRSNAVTGIFMIFNDVPDAENPSEHNGIYIRTSSPDNESIGNSDLQLVRGLPQLARSTGLSLNSFWQARFRFAGDPNAIENQFFSRPLQQGLSQKLKKTKYGCFWSLPFQPAGANDISVITYSIPMTSPSGYVYGVLGIELSEAYFSSLLNAELNGNTLSHCLVLGVSTDNGATYKKAVAVGAKYKQFFSSTNDSIALTPITDKNFKNYYTLNSERNKIQPLHAVIKRLTIYPTNSAFSNEQWALIGIQDDASLFESVNHMNQLVLISVSISVILGILLAGIASRNTVRPITALVRRLRSGDNQQLIHYPDTGILEIDSLSEAISAMTTEITRSAQRTSSLIELSGLPVGVYEIRKDPPRVYCSDGFFSLLGRFDLLSRNTPINLQELELLLTQITQTPIDDNTYQIMVNSEEHFIQVAQQTDEYGTIGSILDVSAEVHERQRIQYERDYDSLTGIYNRRAFENKMDRLFSLKEDQLKISAMIMMDLDNLKFLNDTYGHDCGDDYIRSFAKYLQVFQQECSLIARRSGDEFYVFLYGFASREQAMSFILSGWNKLTQETIMLPDNSVFRMRVSGGISWYPEDSKLPSKLIHYADFAMYWTKHTQKGNLIQFSKDDYNASSYLFNGQDALNRLIDDELVHFVFQPIISAHTGCTVGYELLMRSDVDELRTPPVILHMAKSQGKLHHIEYITWNKGLSDAGKMLAEGHLKSTDLLFINSIANQTLFPTEEKQISKAYKDLLPNLVMEVTEGEDNNMEYTRRKLDFVTRHGGKIAIDDFGTGYNSEVALMAIPANIVKIDISFVRNVDSDSDKQLLIKNLIRFARQRNISVLAEGIETEAELRTLLQFDVDYLQGFFLSRPQEIPSGITEEKRDAILRYIKHK